MCLKKKLSKFVPDGVRKLLRRLRARWVSRSYEGLSTTEVFSKIYKENAWGNSGQEEALFYSGTGSHDSTTVEPYLAAVGGFLGGFPEKPSVVDVGCGDFNVGSRLRPLCSTYIAIDIVPELIEYNRVKFAGSGVEFRCLDIVSEIPPNADVIFIRQVFQHLSNFQISRALQNLEGRCRYLVVTEHLPNHAGFVANLDKPTGPDIRSYIGSGIVLAFPPFNFGARSMIELCRVRDENGYIVTSVYEAEGPESHAIQR